MARGVRSPQGLAGLCGFEKTRGTFERTLRDGLPENRHYGILVANKIIQESGFSDLIHDSDNFSESSGGVLGTTKSKYNQSLYLDQCSVCQYQPQKETDIPLETHHINMQCAAVDNYHGIYHQNELHNLEGAGPPVVR